MAVLILLLGFVLFWQKSFFLGSITNLDMTISIKPQERTAIKQNINNIDISNQSANYFIGYNYLFSLNDLFFLENSKKTNSSFYSSISISNFVGYGDILPGENLKMKIGKIQKKSSGTGELLASDDINNFSPIKTPILITKENDNNFGKYGFSPDFSLYIPANKDMRNYKSVLEIILIEE